MVEYINANGKHTTIEHWSITPGSRAFRYGDGCFETMHFLNNKIILADYHFERLFRSLEVLKFAPSKNLTPDVLSGEIIKTAQLNNHSHARVRVTVYRGEGGLFDDINHEPNYVIQTSPLHQDIHQLNKIGFVVDFFPDGRKAPDNFSSTKNNNFLIYTMGAIWAKEHQLNDAIILNSFGNISDATIANVFIVKDGIVYTPPLNEGPVEGVMRRHILQCLKREGIMAKQVALTTNDVLEASEIFFTNVIYGIRWISQVKNSYYTCQLAEFLHKKYISVLYT